MASKEDDKFVRQLKRELNTLTLQRLGRGGGGCISHGQGYTTDQGQIFVKQNTKEGRERKICETVSEFGEVPGAARIMFDGEAASLNAILSTNTVRVPKPIKVFDCEDGSKGSMLVMEYLDMRGLTRYSAQLGEQMARLHLHNDLIRQKLQAQESSIHREEGLKLEYVSQFGFDVTTCCGFIPQDNTWEQDWVEFFARRKLQLQLDLIEKEFGDREARTLWSELQIKLPQFFKGVAVTPALLHGDLWGGNAAETDSEPVVFDAASFYGHNEYDMAIATMFGGFGRNFFESYYKLIPKAQGFQTRNKLYQLFHYLNHWNHFGTGYRGQSISIMQDLIKSHSP